MKILCTLLSIFLLSSIAVAGTVTFNSYTPLNMDSCGVTISSEGLNFGDASGNGCTPTHLYVWDGGSPNGNGTDALIYGFGEDFGVTITATGGSTFTLNSVDMAISWYDENTSEVIPVTAFLNGGGTVTEYITLVQGLQTYHFSFGDVTSVEFGGIADGYWLMDNVAFNNNAVPEPGSLLTFGSGLLGIAGVVRRKFNF